MKIFFCKGNKGICRFNCLWLLKFSFTVIGRKNIFKKAFQPLACEGIYRNWALEPVIKIASVKGGLGEILLFPFNHNSANAFH